MSLLFQLILDFLGDRQHRSGTERVSCMNTHRVNVFNKADRNLLPLCVTDNLYFQLLPADNRFFDENLVYHRSSDTSGSYFTQLFFVVDDSASGSAHSIGRTDYTGIAKLAGNLHSFFYRISRSAPGHFNAQFIHGILKFDTVFPPADGIDLNTDDFYVIFVQYAGMI